MTERSSYLPPAGQAGARPRSEEASVGDLFSEVTSNLSTLVRQEVALAKAEAKDSATKAAKGAGMLAGAAWAGHFLALFVSLALWWSLATAMGEREDPTRPAGNPSRAHCVGRDRPDSRPDRQGRPKADTWPAPHH